MSEALSGTDLDALVAAILTAPMVGEPMSGTGRVQVFKETLKALAQEGSSYRLVVEARELARTTGVGPWAGNAQGIQR